MASAGGWAARRPALPPYLAPCRRPLLGNLRTNATLSFFPPQAGLRRSFRLGCRERLGGSQEAKVTAGAESQELLTYEEVARYQQQPGERPRLVVLIGR